MTLVGGVMIIELLEGRDFIVILEFFAAVDEEVVGRLDVSLFEFLFLLVFIFVLFLAHVN